MAKVKSMADIAAEAGVSVATVSRVLSGKGGVRPETAALVTALVARYSFRPNAMARSLYNRRSDMLAIVLPDITNPYYARLFVAAEREARACGRTLQLLHHPYGRAIDADIAGNMIERRLDGVILDGELLNTGDNSDDMRHLADMARYMPVVLVGNMPPVRGYRNLTIDLASGARQATERLCAMGHERIVLLGGRGGENHPFSRRTGYMQAMAARGLARFCAHIPGEDTHEDGMRAFSEAFAGGCRPTAALCSNDLVALGVYRAAQARGLRIPGDFSVIGCDNSFLCDYLPVPLTSIDIQTDDMARLAVRMLLADADMPDCVLDCTLILRESCVKPA